MSNNLFEKWQSSYMNKDLVLKTDNYLRGMSFSWFERKWQKPKGYVHVRRPYDGIIRWELYRKDGTALVLMIDISNPNNVRVQSERFYGIDIVVRAFDEEEAYYFDAPKRVQYLLDDIAEAYLTGHACYDVENWAESFQFVSTISMAFNLGLRVGFIPDEDDPSEYTMVTAPTDWWNEDEDE